MALTEAQQVKRLTKLVNTGWKIRGLSDGMHTVEEVAHLLRPRWIFHLRHILSCVLWWGTVWVEYQDGISYIYLAVYRWWRAPNVGSAVCTTESTDAERMKAIDSMCEDLGTAWLLKAHPSISTFRGVTLKRSTVK